ncbi:MAG: acryloyl-CoA reductase [Luteitalea sp.]|nr:acryloyl-CoA reductase [Luteitalea sp.]
MTFRAIRVSKEHGVHGASVVALNDEDLMDGDVTIAVDYSTINYKDGLALTGKAPIIKTFPLVPGIDLAGRVQTSARTDLKPGDAVVVNGWGLGEHHHGGLAQRARVKGEWIVKVPSPLTTHQAMAIGTAGYTAMLAVMALQRGGVAPGQGEVLVTGASGGVGSIAIALLSAFGYRVVASTGRPDESGYLTGLGAGSVIDRNTLSAPGRPLGTERWAGAIDSVGSHTLANVLSQTRYGGTVAACGLAQGLDLPASVAPFILRAVTLAGIDSVRVPIGIRVEAWSQLARHLDLDKLATITSTVGLDQAFDVANRILAGQVRGRTVVDVNA